VIAREITPDDMRALDRAWAIRTGVLGGIFAAFLLATFIDNGRLIAALIGA
jgi:hypothetical protein